MRMFRTRTGLSGYGGLRIGGPSMLIDYFPSFFYRCS